MKPPHMRHNQLKWHTFITKPPQSSSIFKKSAEFPWKPWEVSRIPKDAFSPVLLVKAYLLPILEKSFSFNENWQYEKLNGANFPIGLIEFLNMGN